MTTGPAFGAFRTGLSQAAVDGLKKDGTDQMTGDWFVGDFAVRFGGNIGVGRLPSDLARVAITAASTQTYAMLVSHARDGTSETVYYNTSTHAAAHCKITTRAHSPSASAYFQARNNPNVQGVSFGIFGDSTWAQTIDGNLGNGARVIKGMMGTGETSIGFRTDPISGKCMNVGGELMPNMLDFDDVTGEAAFKDTTFVRVPTHADAASRPATPSGPGFSHNSATGALEYFNGTAWSAFTVA